MYCGCVALDDVDVLVHGVGGARRTTAYSETRWLAGRMSKLSLRSGRRKFQPRCRWRIRLCALYCVATAMRRMPELSAFDSAKSMMRDLPPKKTAGLARLSVSSIEPGAAPARQDVGHGMAAQRPTGVRRIAVHTPGCTRARD